MAATLPTFSRGLKLVRLAVFALLLQLAVTFAMTVKALSASDEDWREAVKWTQYYLLANAAVTLAMFIAMLRAIPELARARMNIRGLVIAVAGFFVATVALAWSYYTVASFLDVATNPDSTYADIIASGEDLKSLRSFSILKDLAYSSGLIAMISTVRRSAIANDQLALRDLAGSMSRALIVMLVGDVFYQFTYGLGGPIGIMGLVGALLIGIYWIYCHLRLARFLYNAAYFFNEPHNLPVATVINAPEPAPRPSQRLRRPSAAGVPAPLVVVPPPAPIATPRATSTTDDDGPRFLR